MATYEYPKIHKYPPFFTKQPNYEVWRKQVDLWHDLILSYSQAHGIFEISLSEAGSFPPFSNPCIQRKLKGEVIQELLEALVKANSGEWVTRGDGKRICLIYWKSPSEWAHSIYAWAERHGLVGGICTVYELLSGEDAAQEGRPPHMCVHSRLTRGGPIPV